MNPATLTTLILVLLTLVCLIASMLAVAWLMFPNLPPRWRKALHGLMPVIVVGAGGLFLYRMMAVHQSWQALESHVDGLILINTLVAVLLCFLQTKKRMEGISAFVLPVLSMLMAWAVLASSVTFQAFNIGSVWDVFHRLGVYLGSVFYLVAAGAGVMFLYVRRQLRRKQALGFMERLPSLEAVEKLLIKTATLGFALISFGLVTGVVITVSQPDNALGPNWWYSPKVILALAAWLVYAIVMNVRHTRTFRGSRAAWLAIIGFILVVATFIASLAAASDAHAAAGDGRPSSMHATTQEVIG